MRDTTSPKAAGSGLSSSAASPTPNSRTAASTAAGSTAAGSKGEHSSATATAATTAAATPHPTQRIWYRLCGIAVFISGGAAALIAGIHLIGRWWHLGWGGLQLPSFAAWLNFQDSPTAMAMLLAEQWGALLAVWVGMFALLVMAAGWGLSRVGDPGRSPHWQIILGEACGMVFALAATVLSLVGMVISRNQNLLLVGIPLGFVLLPWFIGGIGLAVISGRGIYVVRQLRRSQRQTAQRQTTQRQAARKGSQTSPQQTPPKQPPPQQGQAPRISPQKKNQGGNR